MSTAPLTFILTDIEGTTTSVSFVYDVLFPYFRNNISLLNDLVNEEEVQHAFEQTKRICLEEGRVVESTSEIIETLLQWSLEDKKITPLKTLQGILWKKGYETGEIKGHVYEDVEPALKAWKEHGLNMGVFSSGSVAAQKLIFGYSEVGDLCPYFSAYFDTNTGGKRESETYTKIASNLQLSPSEILFLSDIKEELEAADAAGFQTIQLLRDGTSSAWKNTVRTFLEVKFT